MRGGQEEARNNYNCKRQPRLRGSWEGGKGGGASGQMVFISALLALAFEMSENSATKRRCRNYPGMVGTHGGHILLAVTVTVGPVVAYYVVAKPFNMGSISARHQKLRVCVRVCV